MFRMHPNASLMKYWKLVRLHYMLWSTPKCWSAGMMQTYVKPNFRKYKSFFDLLSIQSNFLRPISSPFCAKPLPSCYFHHHSDSEMKFNFSSFATALCLLPMSLAQMVSISSPAPGTSLGPGEQFTIELDSAVRPFPSLITLLIFLFCSL